MTPPGPPWPGGFVMKGGQGSILGALRKGANEGRIRPVDAGPFGGGMVPFRGIGIGKELLDRCSELGNSVKNYFYAR